MANKSKSSLWRIPRTVSITPEQDDYLDNALGKKGNVSEFLRALIDAVRDGKIDIACLKTSKSKAVNQALEYHRSREAGMSFVEDIGNDLKAFAAQNSGVQIIRNRNHKEGFLVDFSVEHKNKVLFSVQCKSSPRSDQLNIALGEAIIGIQKTGYPVVTVVPYFRAESLAIREKFDFFDMDIVAIDKFSDLIKKFEL